MTKASKKDNRRLTENKLDFLHLIRPEIQVARDIVSLELFVKKYEWRIMRYFVHEVGR
jgi:hypothetical protein